jgi:mycothiol synthase
MTLVVRPASEQDIDRLADLLDSCTRRYLDRPTSPDEVAGRLTEAGSDPSLDSVLVTSKEGEVLGFGHVWQAGDADIRCFARVAPTARGSGIGSLLLRRLEGRASELAGGWSARLSTTSWAKDGAAAPVLLSAGFATTRFFVRMRRPLNGEIEEPRWPSHVDVRVFQPGADDGALFEAFCEAFAKHWGHEDPDPSVWWHDHRDDARANFDPSLWFLALDGDELAGFVLGKLEERKEGLHGHVAQIGVRPRWRGLGLGYDLLLASLIEFQRRGADLATLDVDSENTTGALRLYAKAGMRAEPLFTIWSKEMSASADETRWPRAVDR